MTEWQQIETAPKDGTDVLVYSQGNGVAKAAWHDGNWVVKTYQTCCCDCYSDVTHWMPLPNPPKVQE